MNMFEFIWCSNTVKVSLQFNVICNNAMNKAILDNDINPFPKLIDPIIMHQNLKDDYVSKLKSCLPSCPQLSSVTQNVGWNRRSKCGMWLWNMAAKIFDLFHKQWLLLVATLHVSSFAGNIQPLKCYQLIKCCQHWRKCFRVWWWPTWLQFCQQLKGYLLSDLNIQLMSCQEMKLVSFYSYLLYLALTKSKEDLYGLELVWWFQSLAVFVSVLHHLPPILHHQIG